MTVTPNSDNAPWDALPPDPSTSPAPEQPPVEPVRRQRGGRLRWLIALVTSLTVIGGVAVIFILANPPAPPGGVSPLARYAPADSAAYVEARLDLPGDQRDRLISFMSHFPGFSDPQSFDQKISDMIDQMLRSQQTDLRWKQDIEPWFGGHIVVFATSVEESAGTPQPGTVALAVKDRAALDSFLEKERAARQYDASEYRDVTIWTGRIAGTRTAFAAMDDALLMSHRLEELHVALDVSAGERAGLAADEHFGQAMAKLSGDRLLALYIDAEAMMDSWGRDSTPMLQLGLENQLQEVAGAMVGQLRAEADHMLLEMRLLPRPGQAFPALPQNRSTSLAAQFGADVVGYAEVRDVGQGLKQVVAQYLGILGNVGETLPPEVGQFLGVPPEEFLDFLGDAAVAVSADGEHYGGGLIAMVTDEDVARQRLERLVTSLRMMLAFGGDVPLTIDEQQHGGVTVTVFSLRDVPGMDVPFSSFSYAIADGRLMLGADDFVTAALDRDADSALAGTTGYRTALATAGDSNGGIFYLNVAHVRDIVQGEMAQRERSEIDDFWPYFEHFAHVMGTLSTEGDEVVARVLLFVE